jgi:2-polyprenyl-6-methoxyphenol hydroxylase-like FAD-dependent oxidoreductase
VNVAVIGLGTAGGAAATLLRRAGHEVTLFERVPEPGAVGAGIVLQPTGMAVLARLGLVDQVVARGTPITRLTCTRTHGRTVVDLHYRALGDDLYGVGLHRGVLFEALARAARDAGVHIQLGVEILRTVRVRDGRVLVDDAGNVHGPYALVVVADGARSRLAAQVHPGRRQVAYPYGALWFVGADAERRYSGRLLQVVRGARRMLGLLPTGLGPGDGETPLVSLFWSLRADRLGDWRRAGLEAWKADVRALAPAAEPVLAQIRSADDLLFSAYHDVTMWPWDDGDAVVLGDAAHATSPQLGQGCNLALWDAMVLADCLAATGGAEVAPAAAVPAALDAYSRSRSEHLGYFQLATRWLTPFFQGDSRVLAFARDHFMPLGARLPWVRRLMVASMCGTASGFVGARLVLPSRPPPLAEQREGEPS